VLSPIQAWRSWGRGSESLKNKAKVIVLPHSRHGTTLFAPGALVTGNVILYTPCGIYFGFSSGLLGLEEGDFGCCEDTSSVLICSLIILTQKLLSTRMRT